jgi:hypothetical protein
LVFVDSCSFLVLFFVEICSVTGEFFVRGFGWGDLQLGALCSSFVRGVSS